MHFIDLLYNILVNRVPGIRERYKKKRNHTGGIGRGVIWIYLIWLNIRYYIFHDKKLEYVEKYPYYEEKLLYSKNSESSLSCKVTPEAYAEQLSEYDVISFDVFDTLVLRPFSSPSDLFFVLGDKLNYLDFQRIRQEMEWKAREKKYKKEKHYEVTLDEIYTLLSSECGIEKDVAMELELEEEYAFCFANLFMHRVVEILYKLGKRIIVSSDMYLNSIQIRTLLERCGYPEFSAYYVSCDVKKSKSQGDLFDYVKKKEEEFRVASAKEQISFPPSFAHVGDNYIADVEQAKKHGFTAFHYVNVNAAGAQYRPYDMSAITGSVYRGIVNAHIHNGLQRYSKEYEYGYIYGGLFVTGYCQFIHDYVESHQVDKILFLARDGDILSKAYKILYPKNEHNQKYVYWSRLAATKMSAGYFKYDYFRRFLFHKLNQKYTMRQIFTAMELEDMLPDLCKSIRLTEDTVLTERNVNPVKTFLMNSWKRVLEHYDEQLEAGKQYYGEILKGCKNAVAVDIGWAGSGAIALNYIVNQIWNLDCEIVGIIAGTNTCHNAEPDASEAFLQSGKLISYMYSQRENRDIWKLHDPGKYHNLYWELLLDAPMGSFKGFYLDKQGKYECRFKDVTVDVGKVREIQNGILEFVKEYKEVGKKLNTLSKISGRDAYAAMLLAENRVNHEFLREVTNLMDDMNVG